MKLELTTEQVNQILNALAQQPYIQVNELINTIQQQGQAQINATNNVATNASTNNQQVESKPASKVLAEAVEKNGKG